MQHVILGYGYAGFHLANWLLGKKQQVIAISRHLDPSQQLPGLIHLPQECTAPIPALPDDMVLYYLIPPPATGLEDTILQHCLKSLSIKPAKLIYFGSSGVYGDRAGNPVDETMSCEALSDRQHRRLDAERQCLAFCEAQSIRCVLLRIGGIYGPGRLPVDAARKQSSLINRGEAPLTNLVYVRDLANVAGLLADQQTAQGIYNVADGVPEPMGSLQQQVARQLELPEAPFQSFQEAWASASPMKREFMQASKRLDIRALQETLGDSLVFTAREQAIMESLQEEGIYPHESSKV